MKSELWEGPKEAHLIRDVGHPKPIHQGEHNIVECGKHLRFASGPHLGMIFAQGDISPPVQTVFDRPVIAQEGGNGFWIGLGRGQIGEAIHHLLAGFFHKSHLLAFLARFRLWGRRGWRLRRAWLFWLAGGSLLPGFRLLKHFAALALDGSNDLKGLSHAGPLIGKPVVHIGTGAHAARRQPPMSFFRLREEAPGALIGIRVAQKTRPDLHEPWDGCP